MELTRQRGVKWGKFILAWGKRNLPFSRNDFTKNRHTIVLCYIILMAQVRRKYIYIFFLFVITRKDTYNFFFLSCNLRPYRDIFSKEYFYWFQSDWHCFFDLALEPNRKRNGNLYTSIRARGFLLLFIIIINLFFGNYNRVSNKRTLQHLSEQKNLIFCNSRDLRSLVVVGIIFFFSVISWVPQNQMDDMKKFDERFIFY